MGNLNGWRKSAARRGNPVFSPGGGISWEEEVEPMTDPAAIPRRELSVATFTDSHGRTRRLIQSLLLPDSPDGGERAELLSAELRRILGRKRPL